MDQQPKIPTLKDAQKPQVKIKGMGAGLTLFDRLKQFKKKDLAFILAGLGTLFMAPLAEHFMMAPENGDSSMASGFRGPGSGANLFGNGSSPYESGNNGIAQGGAIGGSGDIITPLNVRDPSALVMGPGQSQQPPAGSAVPAAPPPTAPASNSEDLKDALAHSASRAASAATKKAPLPVPKVALGGSGLRGLGVAGGGTSASGGLGPINSGNLGQAGTGGGGLNLVRGAPNYKGVAGARGPGNPTGLDGTKKAGQNAGDAFSRTGSALGGLNAAASEQIPTGASGFGGGGQGGAGSNDKAPGGGGPPGSKSVGESLAFIEAKERMMENLKLEFEKRKLKDPELLLYGIRNDSLKAMASEVTKSLTKSVLGFMDPSSGAAAGSWVCGPFTLPLSHKTCDKPGDTDCIGTIGGKPNTYVPYGGGAVTYQCVKKDGKGDAPAGRAETAPSSAGGVVAGLAPEPGASAAASLGGFCKDLKDTIEEETKNAKNPSNTTSGPRRDAAISMQTEVGKIISARDALYGVSTDNSCGAEKLRTDKSAYEYHGTAISKLLQEGGMMSSAGVPGLVKLVDKAEGEVNDKEIKAAREQHTKALEILQKADSKIATFSGGDAPFNTREFMGDAGGKFQRLTRDAIAAKKGIIQYAQDEKALLTKLDPIIKGAELAGDKGKTPTVPEVIATNGAFAQMATRAEAVMGSKPGEGAKPKETPAVVGPPAPTTPEDDAKAVMEKVRAARTAIGGENGKDESQGALKAVADMEKKKKEAEAAQPPTTYVPTEADKKPVHDAWTALQEAQKQQVSVLSGISGALTDLKTGKPATPVTPTVAAAQ